MVELIVVIAVLAIITAMLSPTLITYTERSRAQKDYSSMDEVVNAVELAIADQNIHDEAYRYSCANNYITYTDSSGKYGQKVNDEEFWAPDGSGRATTITFNPVKNSFGSTTYKLDEAIVNDMTYDNGSTGEKRTMKGAVIEKNQCYLKNASSKDDSTTAYLYNRIRQIVGNTIRIQSQTYGNSSFTIFIRWDIVDGVARPNVYGSFNGTNLSESASVSRGSGTYDYDENDNPIIEEDIEPTEGMLFAIYHIEDNYIQDGYYVFIGLKGVFSCDADGIYLNNGDPIPESFVHYEKETIRYNASGWQQGSEEMGFLYLGAPYAGHRDIQETFAYIEKTYGKDYAHRFTNGYFLNIVPNRETIILEGED